MAGLRDNMRRLQQEAEQLLQSTRGRPRRRKRQRSQARASRSRARPPLANELIERARRATSAIGAGREELQASLEGQLAKRLRTLLERLDIPTRRDIDDLSRRLAEVEKCLPARRGRARRR